MLFGKTKRPRIISGLDIGTTKTCAIIGQANDDGELTILGVGSCPSRGLLRGEIIEIQPTIDAIIRATDQAMEVARIPISDLYVGIAGEHIRGENSSAMVEIRHPRRGIDEKDRRRAIQKSQAIRPASPRLAESQRGMMPVRVPATPPVSTTPPASGLAK